MNVFAIIKLIGAFCWLFHKASHAKVCDVERQDADGVPHDAEAWTCTKCQKSWEVPR